ncbi:beta-N-acetylhexosaminidase [Olivibacter sitiensis]|uniref:beta-N-acetylhexosaminidase n=1 Tax=Olivibacter sitiensis TaxID=376470 RepID=UPI000408EB93|nr:beta-N-acetylhexosaminidase [Olivibacter sitiensis]
MKHLFAFYIFFSPLFLLGQEKVRLIPEPVSYKQQEGYYELPTTLYFVNESGDSAVSRIATMFGERIARPTGYLYRVSDTDTAKEEESIRLIINHKVEDELGEEGYRLLVNHEGIAVKANTAKGIFYGLQTLVQLLPPEVEHSAGMLLGQWRLPLVDIVDYPRFAWRGMMLDVARHFFTKEEVKQFIDNMVKYKFNMLHLHLTDDQGWRIEIKSLPKLTEVGAWRGQREGKWGTFSKPTAEEPKSYGGFYTQDDIRELVQYAAERYVSILPEIDVPGHSMAAVASYPGLSCTPGDYQVAVDGSFMIWEKGGFYGTIDNTLCPANPLVYDVLDKVFTEVAELFPFPYIHMGGDECYKGFWEKSEACKALMAQEGMKDMDALQSYFVKRVDSILRSKGKQTMGWDEILEGGLAEGASVMSWRGMKGGVEAARMGHKVVMSPSDFVYVDLYQGDPLAEPPTYSMLRLRKTYSFDPVPEGIDPSLILGGQCNLWTEQIPHMRAAEYMLWPRAFAVAESVWSPQERKDWNSFVDKVEHHFERFDHAKIKYALSMYDPIVKARKVPNGTLEVVLEKEIESLDIYYSFDETFPDNFYPQYYMPLSVPQEASNLKVVSYRHGKQVGKIINLPIAELKKRAGMK